MDRIEERARWTLWASDLTGFKAQLIESGGAWRVYVAPFVEGYEPTAEDWTEFLEYTSATEREALDKLARWGLGNIIGPDREEFCKLVDERIDNEC